MFSIHLPRASAEDPEQQAPTSVAFPEAQTESAQKEEAEFFVLSYQAPSGCPERAHFEELVRALTAAARFQTPGEDPTYDLEKAPRKMTITVSERANDFFGTLELVDDETQARRQFDADTCEEIVEALALATALAIDPHALGEATEPTPQPAETRPDGGEASAQKPPQQTDEPPTDSRRRFELTLGARGSFQALQVTERAEGAPNGLSQATMSVWEAAPTLELHLAWGAIWSSAQISLGYARAHSPDVDFSWLPVGRFGICPLWLSPASLVRLGACGGVNIGRLESAPSAAIPSSQDATRTYVSADAGLSVQFILGDLRLSAGGGIVVPFFEPTYVLATPAAGDEPLVILHSRPGPQLHVSAQWELF